LIILGANDTCLFAIGLSDVSDAQTVYVAELICITPGKPEVREDIFTHFYDEYKYEENRNKKEFSVPVLKKNALSKLNSMWKKYQLSNLRAVPFEANTHESLSWVVQVQDIKMKAEFTWNFIVSLVCTVGGADPGPVGWQVDATKLIYPKLFIFNGFYMNIPREMKVLKSLLENEKRFLIFENDTITTHFDNYPKDFLKFKKLTAKSKEEIRGQAYYNPETYLSNPYNDSLFRAPTMDKSHVSDNWIGISHMVYLFAPKAETSGKMYVYIVTTLHTIALETSKLPPNKIDYYTKMFETIRKVK